MTAPLTASVVITTRNRKDELRIALASAMRQSARPEVIVIDDGSSDGSAEMVRSEFPGARLVRHEESRGYIVRRNEGARLATGAIVFSIDDDAEFTSPHTVAETLHDFDDPRIGAIAISYIEPKKANRLLFKPPDATRRWITDCFVGTSHAVRRELFVQLGGYTEELVHQSEEREFCVRMLAAGYVVRVGRAPCITHYESPRRDVSRMDFYGRRNDLLFAWLRIPMPFMLAHFGASLAKNAVSVWRAFSPAAVMRGLLAGFADSIRYRAMRRAVPVDVYRLHRRLKKQGPLALEAIDGRLLADAAPLLGDPQQTSP